MLFRSKNYDKIITIEDGVITGGLGTAVLEFLSEHDYTARVKRIGIPDMFVEHGKVNELYHICGMDADGIFEKIAELQ